MPCRLKLKIMIAANKYLSYYIILRFILGYYKDDRKGKLVLFGEICFSTACTDNVHVIHV